MNTAQLIDKAITLMCHTAMSKGAYREVEFVPGISLFQMGRCNVTEYMKVTPIFTRAFDLELKQRGYEKGYKTLLKAADKVQKLQADLKEIMANMTPVYPPDLKVGQQIKLRTRGGDRWLDCEIARRGINIEDGILTVDIDDGPYSEKDTDVYIHDIRLVETDRGWQPFDVDDEFRAFRKRVEAMGG